MLADPDDEAPRLVYADWLEERGDPRGEFIRVQCEREGLADGDERRWALEARERQLRRRYAKGWAGSLRALVQDWQFRRGFVEGITIAAADFLAHADELFRLAPIRRVRLLRVAGLEADLARSPHLARLRGLDLRHQDFDTAVFRALIGSRHLTGLTELDLRGTPLCNTAGMRLLAGCPNLARLTALDLSDHRTGRPMDPQAYWDNPTDEDFALQESGIRALDDSPHLKHLTTLRLAGYTRHVHRSGIEALAGSALLGRLTTLDLTYTTLRSWRWNDRWEGLGLLLGSPRVANLRVLRLARCVLYGQWGAIAESPHLANLTALDVGGEWLGAGDSDPDGQYAGLDRLAAARQLARLTSLRLRGGKLEAADLERFVATAYLPRLVDLDLSENWIDPAGVEALAGSPLLGRLRRLVFQGPGRSSRPERDDVGIGDRGARALAASANAAGLAWLDLGYQDIGDAGARALARSPNLGGLRVLHLWKNQVGAAGAGALAASDGLAGLAELDLRSNPLRSDARQALHRRFGHDVRYGPGPEARNRAQEAKNSWAGDEEADEQDE